jgi:C4-dicarboxylate-specific signal transduction histidine kinase
MRPITQKSVLRNILTKARFGQNFVIDLYEPFYTTKPNGMGMGLAICRSIMEAHGGRLWVTACQPHGALFQFMIPARLA